MTNKMTREQVVKAVAARRLDKLTYIAGEQEDEQ